VAATALGLDRRSPNLRRVLHLISSVISAMADVELFKPCWATHRPRSFFLSPDFADYLSPPGRGQRRLADREAMIGLFAD